jgi:hypothetical protein
MIFHGIGELGGNIFNAGFPVHNISVIDFPDILLFKQGSNHASTVFLNDSDKVIRNWFENYLVRPIYWLCPHPEDFRPDRSVDFESYIKDFTALNYQVRNINNSVANSKAYMTIKREKDGRTANLSARVDYVVCLGDASDADYMFKAVCAIEIQSKPNIELCELQMLTYLLLLMNTKSLIKLVGFLVLKDGRCRTYKATRQVSNVVYEQDDYFHVSFIADVFNSVWNSE